MRGTILKKILVVNNNIDPPYEGATEIVDRLQEILPEFGPAKIDVLRGPERALPKSVAEYDAVFLSGSKTRIEEDAPWISEQEEFIRDLHMQKIPTLGICYGHQLIVRALAGKAHTMAAREPEFGWVKVELLPEANQSLVFASLPKEFHSFQFHSDEVLPSMPKEKFRNLAKSKACAVQAFEMTDAPIWAVQFHPERPLEAGNQSLDRLAGCEPAKKIHNRQEASQLFSAKIAEEIFKNFLSYVWRKKQ